ncbi:MAG: hypothetical protein Q8908_12435 [Bacteroidota bacterium]|nr:hypothetical protein [Bacteroidota bacterium]
MKNLNSLGIIAVLFVFISCSPKISTNLSKSYPALDYKQEVAVIELDQAEPAGSEVLGQVRIGDSGFSINCGYDDVLDKAKLEARKAGGNAIKIIEHQLPSVFGSSCHRITAKILKVDNVDQFLVKEEEPVIPDADYAVINVYRYSGVGSILSFDVHLCDSVICRVKNNYKTSVKVKKDGLNSLWAKTESKSEVPIDIKLGHQYYLKCSIVLGAFVGRPKLELVDWKTGKAEFESFKAKNQ